MEEEEEESEDEDDSFGPKKAKEEESDDPVARKFSFRPLRWWRHLLLLANFLHKTVLFPKLQNGNLKVLKVSTSSTSVVVLGFILFPRNPHC